MWAPRDSNPEPTDYESGALTVELEAPVRKRVKLFRFQRDFKKKEYGILSKQPVSQGYKFRDCQ